MKNLTLLFLLRDQEVLLAMKKRGFGQGRWNGVGGKVEPNETVEQAMIRECEEEIKVSPIQYQLVSEIEFNEYHEEECKKLFVSVFTSKKWEGTPTETEEMSPSWFNFNEIPYEDMWPDDKYWLGKVLDGKKLRASFDLDKNDKIINYKINEIKEL